MGNYKKSWKYLIESRNYLWIIIALFLVSALVGFFFPVFFQDYILNLIKNLSGETQGMNFIQLALFIIKNNISTAFMGFLLGIGLGVVPIIICVFNGYVLGFVSNMAVGSMGFSSLLKLLPHGIFEIPAVMISLALGLKLGMFIFHKNKKKQFIYDIKNCFRVFIYIVLPLLLIAGIIETGLIIFFG